MTRSLRQRLTAGQVADFTDAVAYLLLVVFAVYLVPRAANISRYNGYAWGITEAHNFIQRLGAGFPDGVTLVTLKETDPAALNRLPDIAIAPVGRVSGYVFPYLTALNGKPFVVRSLADFCASGVPVHGVALVTPAATAATGRLEQSGRMVSVKLDSAYAAVADRSQYSALVQLLAKAMSPEDAPFVRLPFDMLGVTPEAPGQVTSRGYRDVLQYVYTAPSSHVVLRPTAAAAPGSQLIFERHPPDARPFTRLVAEYAPGTGRAPLIIDDSNTDELARVDLAGLETLRVELGADALDRHTGRFTFILHNPVYWAPRALSDAAADAPFSFCRPAAR